MYLKPRTSAGPGMQCMRPIHTSVVRAWASCIRSAGYSVPSPNRRGSCGIPAQPVGCMKNYISVARNQIGFDERGIPARRSNSLLFLGGLATDHIDLQLVFQVVFSLSYFY